MKKKKKNNLSDRINEFEQPNSIMEQVDTAQFFKDIDLQMDDPGSGDQLDYQEIQENLENDLRKLLREG